MNGFIFTQPVDRPFTTDSDEQALESAEQNRESIAKEFGRDLPKECVTLEKVLCVRDIPLRLKVHA